MKYALVLLLLVTGEWVFAQDNSPYSRYGLGDITPHTNVSSRGMGNLSSGLADPISVNFTNPASYSAFNVYIDSVTKEMYSGRAVLDVGINSDNRTLRATNPVRSFNSSNLLFSYVQVGIPIKQRWGMAFGLRPLTRVSYDINQTQTIADPGSGSSIDTALTEYKGYGGSYLASIGSGFGIGKNLSLGFNFGYMFGNRKSTINRLIANDTVNYSASKFETLTAFGDIYYSLGAQYNIKFNMQSSLRLGVSGNMSSDINATQDKTIGTFTRTERGDILIDTVQYTVDMPGRIRYPASYNAGFLYTHIDTANRSRWSAGLDYSTTRWDDYRFFGQKDDSLTNSWMLRGGLEVYFSPKRNYFSNVAYRLGFTYGKDFVFVDNQELPVVGFSFGLGLPVRSQNRFSIGQYSAVNLSFEYLKRGNTSNSLRDNMFRISAGFSLSDIWFRKQKYD